MAHDVFISYASENKTVADALCAKMEAQHIRCWIAPRDLPAGLPYGAALVEAIEASRVFVLIFSSHANRSPHVPREVEKAVNKGIPVIPFRIEDIQPNKNLEYFIKSIHWLDALTTPVERHLEELTAKVQALLGQIQPDDRAPPKELPTDMKRMRWPLAAACLVVAALGLGLWFARDYLILAGPSPVRNLGVTPPPLETDRKFITTNALLEIIAADLKTAKNPSERRYVTLTHLWNDPSVKPATLKEWRDAVLQEKPELGVAIFAPVDQEKTVYATDSASKYLQQPWEEILKGDPYALTFAGVDLVNTVQQKSGAIRPYVRADWFMRQRMPWFKDNENDPRLPLLDRWLKKGVGLSTAAADLGLESPPLLVGAIKGSKLLADRRKLRPLTENGAVSRMAWESGGELSAFQEAARELGLGTPYRD